MCCSFSDFNDESDEKKGWIKKEKTFTFDEDVLQYFLKHNSLNNPLVKNNDSGKEIDKDFYVIPVGDTHIINHEKPFELRIGRNFSVFAFEKCIHSMEIGETSLFLCSPHTMKGYHKMEIILNHINYKLSLLHNKELVNNKNDVYISNQLIEYKKKLHERYHSLTKGNIIFILEIELLDVQEPETFQKCVWEMSDDEKYNRATCLKDEGNNLFKSNEFNKASVKFQEALSIFQNIIHSGSLLNEQFNRQCTVKKEIENEEDSNIRITFDKLVSLSNICRLNYSACQLKLKNYQTVIENCTEVIKNDPENIKAYFRRGKAYSMLNSYLDLARKDFYKLKEIYNRYIKAEEEGKIISALLSSNKLNYKNEIKNLNNEIKLIEKKIKQQNIQEKNFLTKMFS
ncbi:TPR-like protein [Anaeromyces robustus]|uniref:TPR-like protein n=1 Tax=Anaeromyces robustus TaxID=1754192 RepID=A0A1Y1WUB4_9FUNG|nr:TPR-like protein [Anaeromyces robustus]|eukprot:ORX76734.1 TPR-like protein [Anaeromyces robustus]